jgi:hypothetical protein
MRIVLALAFSCLILLFSVPLSSASPFSNLECELCIGTLSLLANYTLDDPAFVDWFLVHVFDAASAAGICSKNGGPSGVLTPDVCRGAIGEYGPLIANIVATGPPLIRDAVQYVCEALKLCKIASSSSEAPLQREATCQTSRLARDVPSSIGNREVGTFVVITDVHWDPDYAPGNSLFLHEFTNREGHASTIVLLR